MFPDLTVKITGRSAEHKIMRVTNIKRLLTLHAAAATLVCIVGVFVTQLIRSPEQPLRLAINQWAGYEFAVLAKELGYFEDAGIDVRLLELTSLGDVRRAFERGQADGMFGTSIELVQSRDSGRDPVPVLIANFSNGADALVVSTSIGHLNDLRGKKIGVEVGTLGMYLLTRALDSSGLSWKDIEIVHVPLNAQMSAMELGQLDGVVTFPPNSTKLIASGHFHTIFSSADIPGEVVDLLSIDSDVLASRGTDLDAFRSAYFKAVAFSRADPSLAAGMMSERLGIPPEEILRLFDEEITLVTESEQAEYLGVNGKIRSIIGRTELMLDMPRVTGGSTDVAEVVPVDG